MPLIIGLIVAVAVIYLVYLLIVYVILPITGVLLAVGVALLCGVAGAGLISGVFVGVRNFFAVLFEAHRKLP